MKGKMILTVLVAAIVLGMLPTLAQAEVPGKGDWAIGSSISFPAYGLSAKYWLTNKWCGQLTLVPSSDLGTNGTKANLSAYAGKAIYKLKEGPNHYWYGALAIGSANMHSTSSGYGYEYEYEMNISGVSLTGGIEWVIRRWFVLSFELGYAWLDQSASLNGEQIDLGEYKITNSPMIALGIYWYL